jgi:sulfatase-modifying factor enzyme 1
MISTPYERITEDQMKNNTNRRWKVGLVVLAAGLLGVGVWSSHARPSPATAMTVEYCSGKDPVTSPNDVMVKVGPICVDRYEASVWSQPDGTGISYPQARTMRFPATFPETGNWTVPLYAVSKPNAGSTTFITWFQAQQACALSGKRLLTNAEWQMAAAGTPDPGINGDGVTSCNTNSPGAVPSGSISNCVSNWGVMDMVGNAGEWVADWIQGPGVSAGAVLNFWNPDAFVRANAVYGNDVISGINDGFYNRAPQNGDPPPAAVNPFPSAIERGGDWTGGDGDGVFRMDAAANPASMNNSLGFRCAR